MKENENDLNEIENENENNFKKNELENENSDKENIIEIVDLNDNENKENLKEIEKENIENNIELNTNFFYNLVDLNKKEKPNKRNFKKLLEQKINSKKKEKIENKNKFINFNIKKFKKFKEFENLEIFQISNKYKIGIEYIKIEDYENIIKKKKNYFFTSKFKVGGFKIDNNFKKDFRLKNIKNPFKNLKIFDINNNSIDLEIRKKYEKKIIATSYFKGCCSPLCIINETDNKELLSLNDENFNEDKIKIKLKKFDSINEKNERKCTANILIKYIYNISGQIELQILYKGYHNKYFYPNTKFLKKNQILLDLIETNKKNSKILEDIDKKKKEIFDLDLIEKDINKEKELNKNEDNLIENQRKENNNNLKKNLDEKENKNIEDIDENNKNFINDTDHTLKITSKKISNLKNYKKIKEFGEKSYSFSNVKDYLSELNILEEGFIAIKDIKYLQNNKEFTINIMDMTSNNFIFIYYKKEVILDNLNNLYEIIGCDLCFKFLNLDTNNESVKLPTLAITCMSENLQGVICFICHLYPFTNFNCSMCLFNIISEIENLYFIKFQKKKICNPLFSIDKDSVLISSLKYLEFDFIICTFHIYQAILKKANVKHTLKFKLIFLIKKILNSINDTICKFIGSF